MFATRKMIEQQRLENDAQANASKISQETVEIAAAVSQPSTQTVECQSWYQGELHLAGRDYRQIRGRFSHAKRV